MLNKSIFLEVPNYLIDNTFMSQRKTNEKKEVVSKLKVFLKKRKEIIFAYIHGSFAEGIPFNDIDIAVYVEENFISREEATDYSLKITAEAEMVTKISPLDVKVLNYAPIGFKYFSTKGILLFSKDEEKRCDFLEETWKRYFDLLPKRKQILLDILMP